MYQAVHNLTDQPVVLDAEGHQLGGGEWGIADPSDEETKAALADGRLAGYVSIDEGAGQNPDAIAASKAAKAANDAGRQSPGSAAPPAPSEAEEIPPEATPPGS